MGLVNIKINGQPYQVDGSLTVLEAARKCGYQIPSLCAFNHGKCSLASCRVCLVEVKGARGRSASLHKTQVSTLLAEVSLPY